METASNWIRVFLIAACSLSAVGALYELRGAWRWVIGPAVGVGEKPERIQSKVAFVFPKANAAPAFTTEIGETRFRGSTGYIASATFEDATGRLRIVRSEGLFATPSKGRSVEVAFLPDLLEAEEGLRPQGSAPIEGRGMLLTFDILYGRACLYAFVSGVFAVLLLGLRHFAFR